MSSDLEKLGILNPASSSAPAAPQGYIEVDGVWKRRRMGFVASLSDVKCIRGHVLSTNARFNEDGQILCNTARCKASVYLLIVHENYEKRFFLADVTPPELKFLTQVTLTVLDRLAYLGATFDDPVLLR